MAGFQGDGNPVFVGSANGKHITPLSAEITYIDVGRDIHPGQVPQMERTIGIGQGRGDQVPFEFFLSHGWMGCDRTKIMIKTLMKLPAGTSTR
jgi:hypothetical protein